MSELRECPFCGEIGNLTVKSIGAAVNCINSNCGNAFTNWHRTKDMAITEWNTRADDKLLEENKKLREALQSVVDLQSMHYGNGMKTHLALITKSKEIKSILEEEK